MSERPIAALCQEATALAMEILMPAEQVEAYVVRGKTTIMDLAVAFEVPWPVAKRRAIQLGYKIKPIVDLK